MISVYCMVAILTIQELCCQYMLCSNDCYYLHFFNSQHPPLPLLYLSSTVGVPCAEVTKEILVDLVQKGDVLKVLPGARIPTDGFILAGTAFIDESMITGESVPTLHSPGDAVFGSTVNQQSIIYVKATAIGSEVSTRHTYAFRCVV